MGGLTGFGLFQKSTSCATIAGHMQDYENEVIQIRKVFLILILLLVLTGVPERVQAATLSSKAGTVTTASTSLFVRSSPSSGARVLTTLPKGSYITLISKSGSWWKVEYGAGKYGYCHGDYLTVVQGDPSSVAIQSGYLNVRTGPGTSYGRAASLKKGEVVIRLSTANGWSRILYGGNKTGYVSAQYLSGYQAYPSISLAVSSYKQMDSRWAQRQVGESGKTMEQIGCATTAIAMMESYRTGSRIYPDAMMESLRYTPGGDVYWPRHFTVVTDSSDYLSAIYRLLQQGKPVLFGARNTHGSQHWVVINGYTGGSSLTASGFSILDPGTYSRTNLQQFLNGFPNFYKYFYF